MKHVLRSIVLLLLLATLVSCSESVSLMSFLADDSIEKLDFEGYEFVIKGNWPRSWDPLEGLEAEESSALTLKQDSQLAHNAELMEKYNFKLRASLAVWDFANNLAVDIMANIVDYDLIDTNQQFMVNNIKSGYAIPWEYAGIDVSSTSEYGSPEVVKSASYKGLHYGIWPMNWQSWMDFRGVLGVNNNIIGRFMDVNVHELYENEKWTFEEFKKILDILKTDDSIIPMSYYDGSCFVMSTILANGGNLVSFNESTGKYYYGMRDPKSVRALEFAQKLDNEGLVVEDQNWGDYFKIKQNAAFFITEGWTLGGVVENMDTICYPFGPDAEYGKDLSAYRSINLRYVYMPLTANETDVGKLIKVWFSELEEYPKADIVADLKESNFFNENSYNMWMDLAENAGYDYANEIYDVYETYRDTISGAVLSGRSIIEAIDKIDVMVQAEIDENMNN